ncbi:hypothetical protein SmJEL517_g05040 [Synchytrium microbalum]|uniref:Mob1/phocein n=1 Tax=Synchytrium microbalum TaxID=1806994 RepID=A0A507C114_9FUNG|nr:uncharacterized protein SmJEL517_g05040 [Synchytrium microbalum]TPX31676.1 hypothetical protein SmJEL517_g05040 [Synchytrium microbalum]
MHGLDKFEKIWADMATTKELPNRNRAGIRQEDWSNWAPTPLEDIDSTFALQQYLQEQIRQDSSAITKLIQVPDTQDEDTWQYEHLRQTCLELNTLVVMLEPDCTYETCPEMKADEWMYLCAAHLTPQSCCAMDYIIHTLDGTTALMNSPKFFPSRISMPEGSTKHFSNIARRLYRIFAHSYYHHREIFEEFEASTHLYARFLAFSTRFNLIQPKLIIIPRSTDE